MKTTILAILILLLYTHTYAQVPARPGAFINPVTTVCKGTNGISFTVNPPASGVTPTSYEWSLLGGENLGNINGSSTFPVDATSPDGGRTVVINFGNPESLNDITVSVRAKNANGVGLPREINVHLTDIPSAPVLTSPFVYAGSLATITATGCVGDINWYKANSISQPNLLTSNSSTFNTTILYENTFYYANCTSNSGCSSVLSSTLVHVSPTKGQWAVSTTHPPGEVPGRPTSSEGSLIKSDASGNSYITGKITNSFDYTHNGLTTTIVAPHPGSDANDLFIMKIAPNGSLLWAKTFGMADSYDDLIDLDISTDGFVYISTLHPASGDVEGNSSTPVNFKYDGTLYANVHYRGGAILKINANTGALAWVKNQNENNSGFINAGRSGEVEINDTRLFGIDHQIVANQDFNRPRLFGTLLSSINSDAGNVILNSQKEWTINVDVPTLRWYHEIKLIDNGNSMIVSGIAGLNYDQPFISRIDNINTSTPTITWTKMLTIGAQFEITTDNTGNIYVNSFVRFQSSAPNSIFTFAGENFNLGYNYSNAFVLKYDANGNEIWAMRLLAPNFEYAQGFYTITTDGTNIYVGSDRHEGYITFGDKTGSGPGIAKWFAKIKPDKTCEWLYELPESNSTVLIHANAESIFAIVNGNAVMNQGLSMPISQPANGMSVVKLIPNNNSCKPTQPGNFLTSSSNLCKNQNNIVFTVPNESGINYQWIYRGLGIILNNSTGNSITLNVSPNAVSDTLYCVPSNNCGVGPVRKIFLNINQNTPTAVLSAISDVNFIPNGNVSLNVNLTGTANWTVTLSDGSIYHSSSNVLKINKTGINTNTPFTISSIKDDKCPTGLFSGEVFVTTPKCMGNALHLSDGSTRNVDGYRYNGDRVSSEVLGLTNEITVEMWIYPFENMYNSFFGIDGGLALRLNSGFLQVNGITMTEIPIVNKRWTHIAVSTIPETQTVKIYKNGVFMAEKAVGTFGFTTSTFSVGNDNGADIYFKGMIDEFRIFNYSWTDEDIRNFMIGNIGNYEYDMKIYYDFNRTGSGPGLILNNLATNGSSGNGTSAGPTVRFQNICTVPTRPDVISSSSNIFCKNSLASFYVPDSLMNFFSWSYTGTGVTLKPERSTLTIEFGPNATSGTLSVYAQTPSNISVARSQTISVGNCMQTACRKKVLTLDGNSHLSAGPIEVSQEAQSTITFWMKPNSYIGEKPIFTSSPSNDAAWLDFDNNGFLRINSKISWFAIERSVSSIGFSNEWQFIAISTYGNRTYIYKNGILTDNIERAHFLMSFGNLLIGGGYENTAGFDGDIDDFALWNKALSSEEVQNLYKTRYITGLEYSLQAFFNFNSNSGQGAGISIPNLAKNTYGNHNATSISSNSNFPVFSTFSDENDLGSSGNISGNISGQKVYSATISLQAPPSGSSNTVNTNAKVIYQAGNAVLLRPGFQTQNGSVFLAQIATCY